MSKLRTMSKQTSGSVTNPCNHDGFMHILFVGIVRLFYWLWVNAIWRGAIIDRNGNVSVELCVLFAITTKMAMMSISWMVHRVQCS